MMQGRSDRGGHRLRRVGTAMLATSLALGTALKAASAKDVDVDLELVLAVDVSRSMDLGEQDLQRDGYVAAFRHPEVLAAIGSGPLGRIAVTYVEWAGPFYQTVIVPWTILTGPDDANAFADLLAEAPITQERGTSISGGLAFAATSFAASGARGLRRAVDVSGDGPNNTGMPVLPTRDALVADGITINGLPILLRPSTYSAYTIPNLDTYYQECVIGGPGAFMITVKEREHLEVAIRRKLVLEIAGLPPRLMPAAERLAPAPGIDCLIGEKLRLRWFEP
jgi:Protein of unknown function (DUF1194)